MRRNAIAPISQALAFSILIASCQSSPPGGAAGAPPRSLESLPFPCYPLTVDPSDSIAYAPLDGEIAWSGRDSFGTIEIGIKASFACYWNGKSVTVPYELVGGGLESASRTEGRVKAGEALGKASAVPYVTARSKSLEPALLRMTRSTPILNGSMWHYLPDWLLPEATQWLSFRQVDSFEAAVADFYRRWEIEGNEARGFTFHYFPDLDRIRVPLPLPEYPVKAVRTAALEFIEKAYYDGRASFSFSNSLGTVAGHTVRLYWQEHFNKYLRDEYELGKPLWVYCSVYVIDHERKEIIVCARDFALKSDEEVVEERMAGIGKSK